MGFVDVIEPTPRQLTIIALCARGKSREEIGRALYISPWTVKVDLDRLREYIGARNVTHAVSICIVRGLLVVEDDEVHVGQLEPALVAA